MYLLLSIHLLGMAVIAGIFDRAITEGNPRLTWFTTHLSPWGIALLMTTYAILWPIMVPLTVSFRRPK